MKITRTSPLTGTSNTIDLPVTQDQINRYARREDSVQNIFKNLTPGQREFIMTGITEKEWDKTFKGRQDHLRSYKTQAQAWVFLWGKVKLYGKPAGVPQSQFPIGILLCYGYINKKIVMKHIKVFESFVSGELNEISSETIKSAADIAMSQGQPGRVGDMLKTHFHNYMGKPFNGGTLIDISVRGSSDGSSIDYVLVTYNDRFSDKAFYYDVIQDLWKLSGAELEKREARLLSEIATIMNPQTKYKIASQNLPIKGYGMKRDW